MVLEGTWQMYLNGSHGLRQHREGKGRAPQKHSGRAAAVEGKLRVWQLRKEGSVSWAVTGWGADSNQTSNCSPHFSHPLQPDSKNLLLPKLLIFAKRKPPGKMEFSTPSLSSQDSSLGPKYHFRLPSTPGAAIPERQPICDAASDDAA